MKDQDATADDRDAGGEPLDAAARAELERIALIREYGKEAKAPAMLVRHFIGKGATADEAKQAFDVLAAEGRYVAPNLATFHQAKGPPRGPPAASPAVEITARPAPAVPPAEPSP